MGLERDRQRNPLRAALGQQVADLAEPGGEQQHEADHRERRHDLERAPRELARLELVRHRDADR